MSLETVPLSRVETFEGLQLYLNRAIHSRLNDYRKLLRQEVMSLLSGRGLSVPENILNPDQLPQLDHYSIALSHCPEGSTILLDSEKRDIGVDIEQLSRITTPLIERIASKKEIAKCPRPHLLFSAKEATWKAVHGELTPTTMTEIQITKMKILGENTWSFKTECNHSPITGTGSVLILGDLVVAFFVSNLKKN